MLTWVRFQLPGEGQATLYHGDLIGRVWHAALRLNDGRISEAHAMISRRGRDVRLLALRGRFQVGGKLVSDVVLKPGVHIYFARDLALVVDEVHVADHVLAIEGPGIPRQVLNGVTTLYGGPTPRVSPQWRADGDAHLWPSDDANWLHDAEGSPQPLVPGQPLILQGTRFTPVLEDGTGANITQMRSTHRSPMKLIAHYDTFHIQRDGEPSVVVTGKGARILSELAVARCPVGWHALAQELWPDGHRDVLRRRWDMQLVRLRKKLRDHGLNPGMVAATGDGLLELVLGPHDEMVDRT